MDAAQHVHALSRLPGNSTLAQPAQVIVRSPFAGRLLLSIETDGVVSTQVMDDARVNHMPSRFRLPAGCRPNVFITATVIRAIDPHAAWTTHRATGVTRRSAGRQRPSAHVQLACAEGSTAAIDAERALPRDRCRGEGR